MRDIERRLQRLSDKFVEAKDDAAKWQRNYIESERQAMEQMKRVQEVAAERDALRERMRDALYELAALVPDPSAPDFTLACQNPADVQCLLQAWAILHIDAAPERQGVTVPCTESLSSATPAAPDTKNYCNCPQCQTRDCPAGRELAAVVDERDALRAECDRLGELLDAAVARDPRRADEIRAMLATARKGDTK